MNLELRKVELCNPVAQELIGELNRELNLMYPEEVALMSTTFFKIDSEELKADRGFFLVAYVDDEAAACGAVRRIDDGVGEIKRMFVRKKFRGLGLSKKLLNFLETEALKISLAKLVLETGIRQKTAIALYQKSGYSEIPVFGDYRASPLSMCMEKVLLRST